MFNKFFNLLNHNQKKKFPFLIIFFGLGSVIEVITLASFVPFLNSISAPDLLQESWVILKLKNFFNISSDIDLIKILGIITFSLFIFSAFFRTITLYISNKFIESIRHTLCSKIFRDHLNKDYDDASSINTYELSKVMLSEVDQVITNIVRPIFNLSSHTFLVIGITLLLIITEIKVALTSIIIFLIVYLFVFSIARKKLNNLGVVRSEMNERRFNSVIEALNGLKEIKIFNAIEVTSKSFSDSSRKFSFSQALAATLSVVPNYLIESVAFGGIILITIFNLDITNTENPSLGESFSLLGLFAISFYRIKPSAQSIYQAFSNFKFGEKALENVLNKISFVQKEKEPAFIKFHNEISFKNVSFSYYKNNDNVIKNLSFNIKKGEKVFIQGESGSGKSTILEIICGLRMPCNGQFLIDGSPFNSQYFQSWANLIGYVPQDTFLLNKTIAENIAFGSKEDQIDYNKINQTTEIVEISEAIERLQLKNKSLVGERGRTFSGGQKQRIGIARALYRDPELIIFDEATSALDSITEMKVLENIISFYSDRTLIVVSHNNDLKNLFDNVIYITK